MANKPRRPRMDSSGRLISPEVDRPNGTEPFGAKLPTLSDMLVLSDAELHALLDRYGVTGSWAELRASAMQYAATMSRATPLSDYDLRREVERLVSSDSQISTSRRALLGLARETQRAYVLDSYAEDSPKAEYIRVCEDDARTCDRCAAYAGIIGTLGQHAADPGLPGPASCDGGAYCRCVLVPMS